MTDKPAAPLPGRGWATSSLVAGILWMILAVAPTFVTTLLGLPFAGYAIAVGWLSRRSRMRAGDSLGARRAGWGVGLGCLGFVWLSIVNIVIGGALIAGFVALIRAAAQGTPVP